MHPQATGAAFGAHVHLEHVGAALRELANRVGAVAVGRLHRRFVDEAIAAVPAADARTPGITAAPVRIASAASVDVVAAGRRKKFTQIASGLCMC
jgi:hypothetical protein